MNNEEAAKELLAQTAKITWKELERFFAAGKLIFVDQSLDLITVGTSLIQDNKAEFENWSKNQHVHPVTDQQAAYWSSENTLLWASVVSPWVLVQQAIDSETNPVLATNPNH